MIQLYGLKMSNYYSLTKALLIEKGVAFEEVKDGNDHCTKRNQRSHGQRDRAGQGQEHKFQRDE